MALSLAPFGVRVNAVGPSAVLGNGLDSSTAAESRAASVRNMTPLKRLGDSLEIGQVSPTCRSSSVLAWACHLTIEQCTRWMFVKHVGQQQQPFEEQIGT